MRWWRRLLVLVLAGWVLLLATRCHLPRQALAPARTTDSTSVIYLVRHGWHAGIAVRRADVAALGRAATSLARPERSPDAASPSSADRWPVLGDFPQARYLEVGWGEARYYPGETRGVWGAVRAGAWPTGSVLHVVPIPGSVQATFRENTIVRIPVGPGGLEALTRYVAASFARTDQGAAISAADGFYPGSRFYASGLTYHVFNNCNHWAAGALEAAGCDTSPRWALTVGQVVRQAQRCGTLVQRRAAD